MFLCLAATNIFLDCGIKQLVRIIHWVTLFQETVHISKIKCNKVQFSLKISSIKVSKQTLCMATLLYVYNIHIHTGATPFSRVMASE